MPGSQTIARFNEPLRKLEHIRRVVSSPRFRHSVKLPMPATNNDLLRLHGVLDWARRGGGSTPQDKKMVREVAAALGDAIAFLEKPDQRITVILHLLAMLLGAMRPREDNPDFWMVTDRFTQSFALKQLSELVPAAHHDHVEMTGGDGPLAS